VRTCCRTCPVQPPGCKGKVDLLFVISRQSTMQTEQTQLLASFPGFIDTIEQKLEGFDVHIMTAGRPPLTALTLAASGRATTASPPDGVEREGRRARAGRQSRSPVQRRRAGDTAVLEHPDQLDAPRRCPALEGSSLRIRSEGLVLGRHPDVPYGARMVAHLMTTTATPTHPSTSRSRGTTRPSAQYRRLRPPARRSLDLSRSSSASTRRLSPLRGSKRLHQLSKRWADSREFWGLAGVQALGEFMKYDADLWRKASANKGLRKSASYCVEQ